MSRASVSAIRSSAVAQAGGGVDQGLVELAPILADGVDFVLELGLGFGGLFLLRANRLELLVALAQRVERRLGAGWDRKGDGRAQAPAPRSARGANRSSVSEALIANCR